ncbi:MAG: DUF1844 domain-containing protein [Deltaproteobacteria bacterium]|nr:DUF1844 domain-containing protein [Deltaproteobacteria bacterium]
METDGKGFTVKDKRSFDEEGDLKETKPVEEPTSDAQEENRPKDVPKAPPLPEVNFNSLIFSLSSSALLHLGEIADPQTGEKREDLPMAKHSIDIVSMLKEKSRGNLDDEEQKFIDSMLTDLRLRYVKAVNRKK